MQRDFLFLNNKKLLKAMLGSPNLRFLWPLWEQSGSIAYDYSNNARHGAYDGVTLGQLGINSRIPVMASLDGLNDKITPAASCSIRGLTAITWFGILEMVNTGVQQIMWIETVTDGVSSRFALTKTATNAINIVARSAKHAQTGSAKTTSDAVPNGVCMLHVTVDIANDSIKIYRNGTELTATGTVDFGTDTIFEDTAPQVGPYFGRGASDAIPLWYPGKTGYCGICSGVLGVNEILNHARVGGFA